MNFLIISDIHFQLITPQMYISDWLWKTLKQYFDFWLIINDKSDANISIIFAWDFFNLIEFHTPYEKLYRKNNIASFSLYLIEIKKYLKEKGYNLNDVLYIKGNHEYYNTYQKDEFNFLLKNENIIDEIIKKEIKLIFNIEPINLEKKTFNNSNQLILWNILYSSWINLNDYKFKNYNLAFSLPWIFDKLNDANQLSKIFEKSISQNIEHFNVNQFDELIEMFPELKFILENFKDLIFELKTWISFHKNFWKMTYFFFSYNFLKILKELKLNIKDSVENIYLVTHFPFNFENNKIVYNLNDIKFECFNNWKEDFEKDETDAFYSVNEDFLLLLIDFIITNYKNIKNINFISGHNHIPKKFKGVYKEKYNINFYNNSIWYVEWIKKAHFLLFLNSN